MELLISSKTTGKIYDATSSCTQVELSTERFGSPAKLTISLIGAHGVGFEEGDIVRFCGDSGEQEFYGWIFTRSVDMYGNMTVTCYDRIRYLKANASYSFYDMTAGEIIQKIAADLQLTTGQIDDTGYKIPSLIESDKSCLDIIQDALNKTLLSTGLLYCLYDDGNGLALRFCGTWRCSCMIGDRSGMTGYSYETDIDSDTYNYVKIVRPNETTGKYDAVISQDSTTMQKWGMLQLYKAVDSGLNEAQMQEMAKETLAYYNRRKKTLSFDSLGVSGVRAGQMMQIKIDDVGVNSLLLLESVSHTWGSGLHTMNIETVGYNYDAFTGT